MKVRIENGELIVALPLSKSMAPSKSGKTLIVASSFGNITTDVMVDGKPLTVSVNAYVKR